MTRRLDLIRLCLYYEEFAPEWERIDNIETMEREELELYLDYLRGEYRY